MGAKTTLRGRSESNRVKDLEARVAAIESRLGEAKSRNEPLPAIERGPRESNGAPVSNDFQALTREITKLRHAIERNQQALMNARDAARYVGFSSPVFQSLVAHGVVKQTILEEGMRARYARSALDQLIAERTWAADDIPFRR